jgi:hypothetical protein
MELNSTNYQHYITKLNAYILKKHIKDCGKTSNRK